ncbi:collagen-like protein [Paenisporosarcina sp. TG20]|uniref:collagen-like protein n=1 Tax=Paenisporosarcina sp. TG20 TaxID=1211706 RepID=UPI0002E5516D|nr:collagen-like protein [Paenisporosarcina sp. TG20]
MDRCPKCHGFKSCKCERGPKGPRGYQGPQGPKGEQGIQGERGNQGPPGLKGSPGIKGPKGDPGPRGIQGDKGSQGLQGPKGDQGVQGIQGDKGNRGLQGFTGEQGAQGIQGIQGPPGRLEFAHGFGICNSESFVSGVVIFVMPGPLQDIELLREGLKVLEAGVYQISYKVILNTNAITCTPSRFHIKVNESITIESSMTQSTTATTLASTDLFSLQEGDVVKLVAELQEHFSYHIATLQLIQVG